jgi:hypothetical protein
MNEMCLKKSLYLYEILRIYIIYDYPQFFLFINMCNDHILHAGIYELDHVHGPTLTLPRVNVNAVTPRALQVQHPRVMSHVIYIRCSRIILTQLYV